MRRSHTYATGQAVEKASHDSMIANVTNSYTPITARLLAKAVTSLSQEWMHLIGIVSGNVSLRGTGRSYVARGIHGGIRFRSSVIEGTENHLAEVPPPLWPRSCCATASTCRYVSDHDLFYSQCVLKAVLIANAY